MLKLKNVSKFYYSGGVVTSGFTKVNLDLRRGEFVAITGESGSGKSTLLNVISGLDTYEEGEMYINGRETSAYSAAEFENYRRRYIANIYQSFNLINSYTVFQNVEMVLLLNGKKRREIKKKVNEVLKQVDLYQFRKTKASKLSGGQKQRVAIARALVKDTPIIVADEPTGNLDSASAANVIELLSKLAKDRLVVVVTHNYDQVEPYVTRKITMHDGRITEDLVLREPEEVPEAPVPAAFPEELPEADAPAAGTVPEAAVPDEDFVSIPQIEELPEEDFDEISRKNRKHLSLGAGMRLGTRNAFNIVPKFLLLLFIFLFICSAVTSFYANMRSQDYDLDLNGYNQFFQDSRDTRIVIKKTDGSVISEEDYRTLESLSGVASVFREDVLLDSNVYIEDTDYRYYIYGNLTSLTELGITADTLTYGRMPEDNHEVVIKLPDEYYIFRDDSDEAINEILGSAFNLYSSDDGVVLLQGIRVVGICAEPMDSWKEYIGIPESDFEEVRQQLNGKFSAMTVKVAGEEYPVDRWSMENKLLPSDKIKPGEALVKEDWNWLFKKGKAKGQSFTVDVKNLYYEDSQTFKITDTYNKKTFTAKTGYSADNYDWYNGIILVNSGDYKAFFDKENYQSSVFVKDPMTAEQTVEKLKDLGYTPLYIKDALKSYGGNWVVVDRIINNVLSSSLVVILFLISYFIIKLIMKSRNVYYATVRMLGASSGDCRSLIVVELLVILNLSFFLMLGGIFAAAQGYYSFNIMDTILRFLTMKDYVVLYAVLNLMALLIAVRYSRQLFKKSAMNVYKEV